MYTNLLANIAAKLSPKFLKKVNETLNILLGHPRESATSRRAGCSDGGGQLQHAGHHRG